MIYFLENVNVQTNRVIWKWYENDVENLEFESLCIIVMTHFIAFQINFLFLFWWEIRSYANTYIALESMNFFLFGRKLNSK